MPPTQSRMAAPHDLIFHQKFCAAPDCRARFFICSHCDRGHRYCSHPCRFRSRTAQLREARRRHQHSIEGRLDHRDRQHAYRLRQAAARGVAQKISVTDQTPQPSPVPLRFRPPHRFYSSMPTLWTPGRIVCRVCGREGTFLAPFHHILR